MTHHWPEIVRQLESVKVYDYFKKRDMPAFVEPLVAQLINQFVSSSEQDRAGLLSSVSAEVASILGWYARKLAGRSVREMSQTDLQQGIIAIAIAAGRTDSRDMMAPLSLLYNSAVRLRTAAKPLFKMAAAKSSQTARDVFQAFLERSAKQKAIEAFGFSEGFGPQGFDYLPLLPEFGGPTPF